jgi:transcriptional regulator with XRE-family HTH domain
MLENLEEYSSFETLLNEVYLEKRGKNQSYSLRAFAKKLDIDVGYLSRVMAGKRRLGRKAAKKILLALDVPLSRMPKFICEGEAGLDSRKLTKSEFKPLSRWYFFATLELLLIEPQLTREELAKRFNISIVEMRAALDVLISGGYLSEHEDGFTVELKSSEWFSSEDTTMEKRNFQRQILEKSIEGLSKFDLVDRENSSMIISMDSDLVPEVKEKIHQFIDDLKEFINTNGTKSEVYQVAISLTPLSK